MALVQSGADKQDVVANLRSGNKYKKAQALNQIQSMGPQAASNYGLASDAAGLLHSSSSAEDKIAGCEALGLMGDCNAQYGDMVAGLMNSTDQKTRCAAVKSLGMMGSPAARFSADVVRLLKDKDYAVRAGACVALGGMQVETYVAEIAACLKDPMPQVASGAVDALSLIGPAGREYASDVAKKLEDPHKEVKLSAASYFNRFSDLASTYAAPICGLLNDEDTLVRQGAVGVFQQLRDDAGPLVALAKKQLGASDPRFKAAAAVAIGEAGSKASANLGGELAKLLDDTSEDQSQIVYAVAGIEVRAPPAMWCPAIAAATALASLGDSSAVPAMTKLLSHSSADVRIAALNALGDLGAKVEDDAATLLEAPEPLVRAAAAGCLGKLAKLFGATGCVADSVSDLLADPTPVVRCAGVEALGRMGDEGAAFAETLLEVAKLDRSPEVRCAALSALAGIGLKGQMYASHVSRIFTDLQENPYIRAAAVRALGAMGARGRAFLEEVANFGANDSDPVVQAALADALHGSQRMLAVAE